MRISRFCGYMRTFSPKFEAWHPRCDKSKQSAKIVFLTNSRKFSPSKVSRYMICLAVLRAVALKKKNSSSSNICSRASEKNHGPCYVPEMEDQYGSGVPDSHMVGRIVMKLWCANSKISIATRSNFSEQWLLQFNLV